MNTRKFPRSMAEAFGPYTSNELHPMRTNRRTDWREVIWGLIACAIWVGLGVLLAWRG